MSHANYESCVYLKLQVIIRNGQAVVGNFVKFE